MTKIIPNNQKLHSYYVGEVGDWIQCVACGYRLYYEETYISKNYCPNCGAKMDRAESEE